MRPVLALAVTVLPLGVSRASGQGASPTRASPPADGPPGSVICLSPTRANAAPGVSLPADAWRILYRSTTATGQPTEVSGTVLVPTSAWTGAGSRPLLGFAVGSQRLADRCAAFTQLEQGTEYEASVIAEALSRG